MDIDVDTDTNMPNEYDDEISAEVLSYESEEEKSDDIVIGIDLGTRFSCISIWRNGKFEIIPDQFGNRTIPSVVSFYRSARLCGHNALSLKEVNPKNTIFDIKRFIGRKYDDETVNITKKLVSYDIVEDQSNNNILVQLDEFDHSITSRKTFRPEEICSYILAEIKRIASEYLKMPITKAVITVPAYYNDSQRQATLDSAMLAGLDVLKIINEPTAAALAYGMGSKMWHDKKGQEKTSGNVIIYDFGAGTLDVCLMNISNGVFRVLAVSGNNHLGGEDIDYLIMSRVIIEFKKQHKIKNLELSTVAMCRLKNAVETAKKILSSTEKSVICVDGFYDGKKLYYPLSRNEYELICNDLFIMSMKPIRDVLDSAALTRDDIDDVILVGGTTRIPKIQQLILSFFEESNIKRLNKTLNPDEVVSAGASIYGYILTHNDEPFSQNLVLLDITPLSLGIETLNTQMTTIIPRNTVIPTKKTKLFTTNDDYQDNVTISIYEGERKLTKHNYHVGVFELKGFQKAPRGHPVIKVTFSIDMNGILHVTAHEKKSGVENTVEITSSWGAKGRLSRQEIDQMIEDSEKNEQIDSLYSFKIGLVHKIINGCECILLNIKDEAFKITNADKRRIKKDVKQMLKWFEGKELSDYDIDELESRYKILAGKYSTMLTLIDSIDKECLERDTIVKDGTSVKEGDDDIDTEGDGVHEAPNIKEESYDYDKEEIKEIKKTIIKLLSSIEDIMNSPMSNFNEEDIEYMRDYSSTVQMWLYLTPATTLVEYIAKIDEINTTTENIMKKYDTETYFAKNENFTIRDELNLTCVTLNTSIKSQFFSLSKADIDILVNKINETMIWLHSDPDIVTDDECKIRLDEISDLCNNMHNNLQRFNILDNVQEQKVVPSSESSDDDNGSDQAELPDQVNINIDESIDKIIDQLSDTKSRTEGSTILGLTDDQVSIYRHKQPAVRERPDVSHKRRDHPMIQRSRMKKEGDNSNLSVAQRNILNTIEANKIKTKSKPRSPEKKVKSDRQSPPRDKNKSNSNDLLLKVDFNKLSPNNSFNYKD